jgi:MinD superfamily P-loop ATPase
MRFGAAALVPPESEAAALKVQADLLQKQLEAIGKRIEEIERKYTCAEVCQYHAIAVLGPKVLVFPQLCHGCGGCTLVCPAGVISEAPDVMGVLESGMSPAGIPFARGVLNIGEPMAVPVIRALKKWATPQRGRQSSERAIAEGIARGKTLVAIHPEYAARFRELHVEVAKQVRQYVKES